MSKTRKSFTGLAVAGLVAALAVPAGAQAPAPGKLFGPPLDMSDCFRQRDWTGWTPADENTVYLGTKVGDVYKLSLYGQNNNILQIDLPGRYLLTRVRNTDLICSAQDFDMKVVDQMTGAVVQLFPQGISKLTEAEAQALPPALRSSMRIR